MGTAADVGYSDPRHPTEAIFTTKGGGKGTSFTIAIPLERNKLYRV